MVKLTFKDFSFIDQGEKVKLQFLRIYSTFLLKKELLKIAPFYTELNSIIFSSESEEHCSKQFMRLVGEAFNNLTNDLTGKRTIYIHRNSQIPLLGSLAIGIIDKGTDMLEIKPLTGCNLDCIFCSVDEGPSSKKTVDFVVEKDYLVERLKTIVEFKATPINIYINPHGEPLLYSDLIDLISDLKSIDNVASVSVITNGVLLNSNLINKLISASCDSINLSLSAVDDKICSKIYNSKYAFAGNLKKLILEFKSKIKFVIAPVYLPGINEEELDKIIQFSKEQSLELLIQNFMTNKRGRRPVKSIPLNKFFDYLSQKEKEYGIRLIMDYNLKKTKELRKPLDIGDIIRPEKIIESRYPNEFLAVCKDRLVTVSSSLPSARNSKIRITKNSHNIYYAELV